jgi:hypothetical protein
MVTLKTSWRKVKTAAGVEGRWHDNRHTFITELAESGQAADETIRDIAGHVSKQMLRHYSHIGMEAKRRAVAALISKADGGIGNGPVGLTGASAAAISEGDAKESTQVAVVNS